MNNNFNKILLFLFIGFFFSFNASFSQNTIQDNRIKAALRVVGHQLLLQSNDSTSLVLPIERENNRYKIAFDTEFQFDPNYLVHTMDSVLTHSKIVKKYLVEVEEFDTEKIVYSYEMGIHSSINLVPCRERIPPKSCYTLFLTVLDFYPLHSAETSGDVVKRENVAPKTFISSFVSIGLGVLAITALVCFFLYKRKAKSSSSNTTDSIPLGRFIFDKKNMLLKYDNQTIELSSKEANLLAVLHESVNETVERDVILNIVWGDEGDYIGRTLDVFISKLRKKMEADDTIKIMNIRGVGYKLIIN